MLKSKRFLGPKELAAEVGLSLATIKKLRNERKIPSIRLGYRTVVYDLDKVCEALSKFETLAV